MRVNIGMAAVMIGGVLLGASGARGAENAPEAPHALGSDPAVEPLMQPPPAPSLQEPAPAPPLSGPAMIHEPRTGFLIAGVAVAIPAFLLQMLSTLAYSPTIQTYDQPCSYCATAEALNLIPIFGPWLAAREAGTPDNDPFALLLGGVEAAAVTMIVVGVVGHDVPAEPAGSKVSLAPFVTPQAGGLSLHVRW